MEDAATLYYKLQSELLFAPKSLFLDELAGALGDDINRSWRATESKGKDLLDILKEQGIISKDYVKDFVEALAKTHFAKTAPLVKAAVALHEVVHPSVPLPEKFRVMSGLVHVYIDSIFCLAPEATSGRCWQGMSQRHHSMMRIHAGLPKETAGKFTGTTRGSMHGNRRKR